MSVLSRLALALLAILAFAAAPSAVQAKAAPRPAAKEVAAPAKAVAVAPPERFPLTGAPAFEVSLLPGWKASRANPGSLDLSSPDTAVAMTLITWDGDPRKTRSDDEIAAGLFSALGSAPYTRKEPIKVGASPAQNYVGLMIRDDGMQLDLNLIVIRLDPTHSLVIAMMSQFGDGGTGIAQGKAQLARIRVIPQ